MKLFTERLPAELLDTTISVSVIISGAAQTEITEHSGIAALPGSDPAASRLPMTRPDVAARIMIEGIEKKRLHIHVGKDAHRMSLAMRVASRHAIGGLPKRITRLLQGGVLLRRGDGLAWGGGTRLPRVHGIPERESSPAHPEVRHLFRTAVCSGSLRP